MKYAIALVLSLALNFQGSIASANCAEIASQLRQTRTLLIEHSSNIIVAEAILEGTEAHLLELMINLNDLDTDTTECAAAEISGGIAEGLQAVSNLRERNVKAIHSLH